MPQKAKIKDYAIGMRGFSHFKYYAWISHGEIKSGAYLTKSKGKHLINCVIPFDGKGNVKEIVNLYLFEKSLNKLGEENENT